MGMSRAAASRIAWALAALTGLILVPAIVYLVLGWPDPVPPGAFGFKGFSLGFAIVLVVVGVLIATRRPRNPIGWLLLAGAVASAIQELSFNYALYELARGNGDLARYAAWVNTWIWIVSLTVVTAVTLLFPEGRLRSPRWRWALWGSSATGTLAVIATALLPGRLQGFASVDNPFGAGSRSGLVAFGSVVTFAWAGCLFAAATCAWLRYRDAVGDERAQLRWFVTFGPITAALLVINFVAQALAGARSSAYFATSILVVLSSGAFLISIAVAVLKYRLYEIDVVIKKTVVFATVVVLVTASYLVLAVALPAAVLGRGSGIQTWAVAIGIGIGLLVFPIRNRARRFADRIVYGKRATPYEILEEFSDRMSEAYATEDVLPRMARILGEAVGAEGARVWLRLGSELRPAGLWPADGTTGSPVGLSGDGEPPVLPGDLVAPVRHQGELLGALEVTMPANDPMNPERERLVHGLAGQAGLVLRNVALIEDLKASRQRLVAAQDEERRKIERNLHDGAQQQLVALAVKLRLIGSVNATDPAQATAMLEQAQSETQDAIETLRDLARGIYPPLLADKGLAAALDAQARKAAINTEVSADGIGRYPQEAEAAVYFCCLEAMQNAAKYAHASHLTIQLRDGNGELRFEVEDDGTGFDPATTPRGAGLQNMADRLAALGGEVEVHSSPGTGTTIAGRIPAEGVQS